MTKTIITVLVVGFILVIMVIGLTPRKLHLISNYTVRKYKEVDRSNRPDLPVLSLFEENYFTLNFKDRKIEGSWETTNYGKLKALDFAWGNNSKCQAFISGNEVDTIRIYDPSPLKCHVIKYLEFTKNNEK